MDGLLRVQALCYLAPVREGPWSSVWNMGLGCSSYSVPGCCAVAAWKMEGVTSLVLSYILRVLSKEFF